MLLSYCFTIWARCIPPRYHPGRENAVQGHHEHSYHPDASGNTLSFASVEETSVFRVPVVVHSLHTPSPCLSSSCLQPASAPSRRPKRFRQREESNESRRRPLDQARFELLPIPTVPRMSLRLRFLENCYDFFQLTILHPFEKTGRTPTFRIPRAVFLEKSPCFTDQLAYPPGVRFTEL